MYIIKYIKQKETKNAIKYITTLIASGITGILIFPYSIKHIFFSYRGQEVTNSFLDFSNIVYKIEENIIIINHEVFHGLGYIIVGLMIALCIIWIMFKKNKNSKYEKDSCIKYVTVPTIIYLIVSVIASPYEDLRYLMPIIPLIFLGLIYMAKDLLQDILDKKMTFLIIIIVTICFITTVIPKLSNNTYSYTGHKKVLDYVEANLSTKPMLYIYDDLSAQNNKTMEMYEALTKVDKSYIISTEKVSISKIKEALNEVDISQGFTLVLNRQYAEIVLKAMYNNNIFTTFNHCGSLGWNDRFVIYELK